MPAFDLGSTDSLSRHVQQRPLNQSSGHRISDYDQQEGATTAWLKQQGSTGPGAVHATITRSAYPPDISTPIEGPKPQGCTSGATMYSHPLVCGEKLPSLKTTVSSELFCR